MQPDSHGPVPIIDFGPYIEHLTARTKSPSHDRIRQELLRSLGEQLDRACLDIGFFYCINHGVDPSLREAMFQQSAAFFHLPQEVKDEIGLDRHPYYRGYARFGHERTLGKPDLHESLDYSVEYPADHPLSNLGIPLMGPNPYPRASMLPHFRTILSLYWQAVQQLGERMMSALAVGMGLHETYFTDKFSDPYCGIRLLRYPSLHRQQLNTSKLPDWVEGAMAEGAHGVGPHTDFGCLTILAQDDIGGLQVLQRSGKALSSGIEVPAEHETNSKDWADVPPIKDSFVVNIGDMIEVWTNGRYKATLHRVVQNTSWPAKDRYSIPFFYEPNFACEVSPLDLSHLKGSFIPTFADPSQVKIHYGKHFVHKVIRSFTNVHLQNSK